MHILQTVEETLTPTKELSAGPYSFMQIRAAIGKQASACTTSWEMLGGKDKKTVKSLQGGEAFVQLTYHSHIFEPRIQWSPRSEPLIWLRMATLLGNLYQVEMEIPITKGGNDFPHSFGFHNFRQQPPYHLFTYYRDLQIGRRGLAPKDLAQVWLGIRWLCRNLREWDKPGITWPEEL